MTRRQVRYHKLLTPSPYLRSDLVSRKIQPVPDRYLKEIGDFLSLRLLRLLILLLDCFRSYSRNRMSRFPTKTAEAPKIQKLMKGYNLQSM